MKSRNRVATSHIHRVRSGIEVSDEAFHTCAGFGVIPEPSCAVALPITLPTTQILQKLKPGAAIQVVGASGEGKSSLLRGLCSGLPNRRILNVSTDLTDAQQQRPAFDVLDGDVQRRTQTLAMSGLAEPTLWARPAGALSVGEQARLRVGMALHRSQAGDVVIADEFGSTVDRISAYSLAHTVRRFARALGVTLVVASAHEDLESMFCPDAVIEAGTLQIREACKPLPSKIRIEPGTTEDFEQLKHLHYRSGTPATIAMIFRAMRKVPAWIQPTREMLAGVLCISMPTLNGAWRERAWPGFFRTGDKRRDARRLNEHLRTISRVIVAPHSRGLGVASKLVRTYLENPLTQGTEAIASMGAISPFFSRAGMCEYPLNPDQIDTRLLDALEYMQIAPAELVRLDVQSGTLLWRELTTWGRKRKLIPAGPPEIEDIRRLTPIAATRLCSSPRAYAFVKGQHEQQCTG